MIPINIVYEDVLSGEVMKKILHLFHHSLFIHLEFSKNGYGYIKTNISKFNLASKQTCYFVLTDLDLKECAISLREEWIKEPINKNLIFRVAVREVEAWLLADKENFANFLGVSSVNIPLDPEKLRDPKQELINISKKSKHRDLREDIIPRQNSTAKQGPNYNSRLIEFIEDYWDINTAARSADSLRRCIKALEVLANKINSI